jgi:phage gp45-like
MPMFTSQHEIFQQSAQQPQTVAFVTIGTVVDTNDPQQMGRVRVVCPQWGDTWGSKVENLPWAIYMTPFGGQVQVGTRGPGVQESKGGVAYGMWAVPKTGSQVAVLCIDGNPMNRMYFGCIYDQFTPHTMPHGRFMYDDHPELEKGGTDAAPYGPFTSAEKLIQPLAQNVRQAFGNKSEPNFEFRSRIADYTVSRVDVNQLGQTYSKVQDDKDIKHDSWTSTQGYQVSRTDPNAPSSFTDRNYDSMVYSFTSPGFHSLSMDDRQENCRVRLRTTAGHQILMDDTNERIYIATAQGNNWIEMDQDGNIDIFTTNKVNVHANKDINMTSDETIRLYGKKGVHIKADEEVRIDAAKDIHIKSAENIRVHATQTLFLQSDSDTHFKSGASMFIEAAAAWHAKAGSTLHLDSSGQMNLNAGGQLLGKGTQVHFNGPSPSGATAAAAAGEAEAFYTSRIPEHEPWARSMTKDDTTPDPEFPYDSKDVGKSERGRTINRGMYWRR